MFTNLEKLMDFKQFQELFDALAENGESNYSENGLNISAKASDGCTSLQISYEEPSAKKEVEDFEKYLENLDDDLFVETCESLGNENVVKINQCLKSNNIESVRSAIMRFKTELKEILTNKIQYYTECLNQL